MGEFQIAWTHYRHPEQWTINERWSAERGVGREMVSWTIIRIHSTLELWERCSFSPSERICVTPDDSVNPIGTVQGLAEGRLRMYQRGDLPRTGKALLDDGI